jgi:L-ascorbate metabolism protein UlaG (beta-lactamase superfamily)
VIEPALRDEAFLADLDAARLSAEVFHLWWLGQSGFLIQWQNRHLLLDPYLSDSLTRKYANTDKPHVRMTGRVVDPERLNLIDVVTSSHSHTDHLDGDTLVPLLRTNPDLPLIIPEANREFVLQRLAGVASPRLIGLDAGQCATSSGFKITAIPAAHEKLEKDDKGHFKCLGYIIEFGPWTVYHSGDTLWYDGLVEWLTQWRIDVMLLPINGRDPARGVAGNLNAREAARLAHKAGARLVIPCHYDMFEFNTADPGQFVQAAAELRQACRVLCNGERWSSSDFRNELLRIGK